MLCRWRQARTREQPTTKTVIIVAVRRASGAIFLACFSNQGANLPCRCGKRTLVVVRLVARHLRDQQFEVVGHAVLLGMWHALHE